MLPTVKVGFMNVYTRHTQDRQCIKQVLNMSKRLFVGGIGKPSENVQVCWLVVKKAVVKRYYLLYASRSCRRKSRERHIENQISNL